MLQHADKTIKIADVAFSFGCEDSIVMDIQDEQYRLFSGKRKSKVSDQNGVTLRFHFNGLPEITGDAIFISGQSWTMFRNRNGKRVIRIKTDQSEWSAEFETELAAADIYFDQDFLSNTDGNLRALNPVRHPLLHILLMYKLAQIGGALFHSGAVMLNRKGFMFPGKSGAGKTTLTRLFMETGHAENILSDERVGVRIKNNEFYVYGSPWPGEAQIAKNDSAPLNGIFFITRSKENRIIEISRQEAFERLLPVISIPWYDKDIVPKMLDFCENLVTSVPCYELQFKPDTEIVDVIEKFVIE